MESNGKTNVENSSFSEMPPTVSKAAKSSSSPKKAPSRYHGNRRIRLPYDCARSVFQLGDKLGHHRPGQTIEWLINEAKSSIIAVLETNPTPPTAPPTVQAHPHPPPPPPTCVPSAPVFPPNENSIPASISRELFTIPLLAPNQNLTPASISQLVNVSFDLDEEIAKYFRPSE